MTRTDLQRHIAHRSFLPVYYLHGEDDYLIECDAAALARAALEDGDPAFNSHTFFGPESSGREIAAAANAFPFLSERRIILVRDAQSVLDDAALTAYLRNPAPDTVLILAAPATEPRARKRRTAGRGKKGGDDILAYLSSPSNACGADVTIEYKTMRAQELAAWISDQCALRGKSITREAVAVMQMISGDSTRAIAAEIEKLHIALGDTSIIEEHHVHDLLGGSKRYNLFELRDAVFRGDTHAALEILATLQYTESPTAVVFFLAGQFSILWRVSSFRNVARPSDEDIRKTGIAFSWQFDQLKKFLTRFPKSEDFQRCFEYLLEADTQLKTRPTAPTVVLSRLIFQLSRRSSLSPAA